jgi:hypothetical protein
MLELIFWNSKTLIHQEGACSYIEGQQFLDYLSYPTYTIQQS